MTTMSSILPPSGLSRIVDLTVDSVRAGVRQFWRGAHANAPAGRSLSLLNRLIRIVRFVFVILAVHIELAPQRPRKAAAKRSSLVHLRKPAFPLFPRYTIRNADAPKQPHPAAFARAERDPILTVERKLAALTRALNDPLPLIRRMARRLPTQLMVFGWRPPKRPPPTHRRAYWDELIEVFREAKFHLSEWRRRRRDIENNTPGSAGSGEPKACPDG